MASEVFSAKESSVNPINGIRNRNHGKKVGEAFKAAEDSNWKVREFDRNLYPYAPYALDLEDKDTGFKATIIGLQDEEKYFILEGNYSTGSYKTISDAKKEAEKDAMEVRKEQAEKTQVKKAERKQKAIRNESKTYNVKVRNKYGEWENVSMKAIHTDELYEKLESRGYDASIIMW